MSQNEGRFVGLFAGKPLRRITPGRARRHNAPFPLGRPMQTAQRTNASSPGRRGAEPSTNSNQPPPPPPPSHYPTNALNSSSTHQSKKIDTVFHPSHLNKFLFKFRLFTFNQQSSSQHFSNFYREKLYQIQFSQRQSPQSSKFSNFSSAIFNFIDSRTQKGNFEFSFAQVDPVSAAG